MLNNSLGPPCFLGCTFVHWKKVADFWFILLWVILLILFCGSSLLMLANYSNRKIRFPCNPMIHFFNLNFCNPSNMWEHNMSHGFHSKKCPMGVIQSFFCPPSLISCSVKVGNEKNKKHLFSYFKNN